jgi:N-acetylglucosaminyl-diphospho-decaprenol L-rhamnosyltransferase
MLLRTLATIEDERAGNYEVVVVDNGSDDGSVEAVRERFPEVGIEPMGRNLGFGPALNAGIAARPGADPVILLNNDVRCQPGFVAALVAAAGEAEMVAGVLLQDDRPQLIDSAGVVAEADTLMAFDHLHGEDVSALESAPAPLGPCGGAALYSRAAFDAVGGFDERIFVYYEDVDLAMRMRVAGSSCATAPAARALHAYSATLGSRSGRKYEMTGWSRGYLLRVYGVTASPLRAARAAFCELALCAGQLLRDHTVAGLRGRVRGWRDGAGVPRRQTPPGLLDLSVRERLRLRASRRR